MKLCVFSNFPWTILFSVWIQVLFLLPVFGQSSRLHADSGGNLSRHSFSCWGLKSAKLRLGITESVFTISTYTFRSFTHFLNGISQVRVIYSGKWFQSFWTWNSIITFNQCPQETSHVQLAQLSGANWSNRGFAPITDFTEAFLELLLDPFHIFSCWELFHTFFFCFQFAQFSPVHPAEGTQLLCRLRFHSEPLTSTQDSSTRH